MAKAACSRPHPSSADRARSLSTRAPTMTFIMVLSTLAAKTTFCFCSSTARTGHGHSLPLAGGTHHLPVHAASEFGDAAMARSSCGRATISCLVHALGTRTVREPLFDCTVLCVGRARTGHGCQSDSYYICAGPCAAQATGRPTAAAVYEIFPILRKLEMQPTFTIFCGLRKECTEIRKGESGYTRRAPEPCSGS